MNNGLITLLTTIRDQHDIEELDTQQVHQLQASGETIMIDVREQSEWEAAHIPHSLHLAKGVIEVKIESIIPDKNQEIVLYCGGGTRSLIAAANLKIMGYQRVISMSGGFRAWQQQFTVVSSSTTAG